ncbi:serine/arginine-rich splicing factor 4-like [Amphibalanus amphitrite]|uniref:serine/arginine-rich splicing factor 4-like n=1 Tax=Amphibalanus amphitrite TaxID=1232801 RepID=UPI001C8FB98F|nr:serine/arginine-rich splicing factor 4-like [Amphibalanus amphitrite]
MGRKPRATRTHLRRSIQSSQFHNRRLEEDQMWASRARERERRRSPPPGTRGLRMDQRRLESRPRREADRRRPELDSAMRRARRDGQQSMYWTKKLLDFEERDPDRWGHSGFRELYMDSAPGAASTARPDRSRERQPRERPERERRERPDRERREQLQRDAGRRPAASERGRRQYRRRSRTRSRSRSRTRTRSRSGSSSSSSSYSGSSDDRSRSGTPGRRRRRRSSSSSWSSSSTSVTSRSASPSSRPAAAAAPVNGHRRPAPRPRPAADRTKGPASDRSRAAAPDRSRPSGGGGGGPRPAATITRRVSNPAPAVPAGPSRRRPARSESADSSSSSAAEEPARTSLSERFGRLAQLSSQRGAAELVRLKIVKDAHSSDKKVILEEEPGAGSGRERSQQRLSFETEYREYFGQKLRRPAMTDDPGAELPRQLPRDWETDVSVRYRYYRDAGYFRDQMLTLDEYIKWEQWWYRYREWLAKETRRAHLERPPAEQLGLAPVRRLRPVDWRPERRPPRRF